MIYSHFCKKKHRNIHSQMSKQKCTDIFYTVSIKMKANIC